jgi:hypothetical protein
MNPQARIRRLSVAMFAAGLLLLGAQAQGQGQKQEILGDELNPEDIEAASAALVAALAGPRE